MIKSLLSVSTIFKKVFYHLFLSAVSVDFYRDVIRLFKGYGLQQVLNLSLFAAFFCCLHVLFFNHHLADFLENGQTGSSNKFQNIDFVISQLPEMNYNGQSIEISADEAIKIATPTGKTIIAIDPEKTLKPNEIHTIPLTLYKDNFNLKIHGNSDAPGELFTLEYSFLFGKEPGIITPDTFRARLLDISNGLPSTLIYLFFPVLVLIIFINSILSKLFIVLFIFIVTNMLISKLPLMVCFRLVLYSSGIVILLQPLADIAAPQIAQNLWILQLWTNLLMINAVIKESQSA